MSMHVVRLKAAEADILIDRAAMDNMRQAVGDAVFDEIFEDAVFEITDRLAQIETLARADNFDRIARVAHDLVAVAGTIGLTGVSDIAANLEFCCEDGDLIGAQAVASRLIRIGEDSLVAAAEISVAIVVESAS